MKENFQNWDKDCKRYVGFIDILGFKAMVARDHEKSGLVLDQVSKAMDSINKIIDKSIAKHILRENIVSMSFSDCILFVSKSDTFEDLITLSSVMKFLQETAIEHGIPTKGAISYGFMTADIKKSIFYGQPLIDAYLLQGELYYYGIILDNEAETKVKEFSRKNKENLELIDDIFFQVSTPLKIGKVKHLNLILRDIDNEQINKLYNTVSGSVRKYVDNTAEVLIEMSNNKSVVRNAMRTMYFIENVNGGIETSDESGLIIKLITAQSIAFTEVFALTVDINGYYEKFWMGENGDAFIKSNTISANRGAVIKRIFVMDSNILTNSKNSKHKHFKELIEKLKDTCPGIKLYMMDYKVFKKNHKDIPETSFFICDNTIISESGIKEQQWIILKEDAIKYNILKNRFEELLEGGALLLN